MSKPLKELLIAEGVMTTIGSCHTTVRVLVVQDRDESQQHSFSFPVRANHTASLELITLVD